MIMNDEHDHLISFQLRFLLLFYYLMQYLLCNEHETLANFHVLGWPPNPIANSLLWEWSSWEWFSSSWLCCEKQNRGEIISSSNIFFIGAKIIKSTQMSGFILGGPFGPNFELF